MEFNIGMTDNIIISLHDNVVFFFLPGTLNAKIFNVIRKYFKKSSHFYTFVFLCLIPLLSFSWNNLSETKNQIFHKASDPFCLATCIFVLTVSWSGNLFF